MFRKKKTPTNCDVKLIQLNLLWRDNWILFSHLIGTDCSFAPSNPTITAPRTFRPTRTTLYYIPYMYICTYICLGSHTIYVHMPECLFKYCCQRFARTYTCTLFISTFYSGKWPNIAIGPKTKKKLSKCLAVLPPGPLSFSFW